MQNYIFGTIATVSVLVYVTVNIGREIKDWIKDKLNTNALAKGKKEPEKSYLQRVFDLERVALENENNDLPSRTSIKDYEYGIEKARGEQASTQQGKAGNERATNPRKSPEMVRP